MRTLAGLAAVGVALLMLAPSGAAVHGSPYVAHGVAYVGAGLAVPPLWWFGAVPVPAGVDTYDITVEWRGWWYQTYRVLVEDPDTGQVLYNVEFRGHETWGWGQIWGNTEILQYHGMSMNPAFEFDVRGIQTINLQTQKQFMLYTGEFEDLGVILYVHDEFDNLL